MSRLGDARRKLATLRRLAWSDRVLVAEATVLLVGARMTLWLVPWRWYKRWLTLDRAGDAGDHVLLSRMGGAVAMAARNLPIEAACLPQAMAAKLMLARRGIASSLVIGAGQGDDRSLILHAWLEAGDVIVTGGPGRSSVTPMITFGRPNHL